MDYPMMEQQLCEKIYLFCITQIVEHVILVEYAMPLFITFRLHVHTYIYIYTYCTSTFHYYYYHHWDLKRWKWLMWVRIIYNSIILIIVMVHKIWTWSFGFGNHHHPRKVHCYIGATDIASTIPMANLHIFKFSFPQQPLIRSNNIYSNCCGYVCLA